MRAQPPLFEERGSGRTPDKDKESDSGFWVLKRNSLRDLSVPADGEEEAGGSAPLVYDWGTVFRHIK